MKVLEIVEIPIERLNLNIKQRVNAFYIFLKSFIGRMFHCIQQYLHLNSKRHN